VQERLFIGFLIALLVIPALGAVSVTKTTSTPNVNAGDTVTFLINVTNNDTFNYTGYVLNDTFDPAFLSFKDAAPPGSNGSGYILWPLNLNASDPPFLIEANFTALQAGNTTNNVTVFDATNGTQGAASAVVAVQNGGGGGGYSASGLTSAGTAVTLSPYGAYSFIVGSETHTLRVESIGTDNVTIRFSSAPVDVTLVQGEGKNVDITGDGTPDVYVELVSFTQQTARFLLGKARETVAAAAPTAAPSASESQGAAANAPAAGANETAGAGTASATAPTTAPAAQPPPSGGSGSAWPWIILALVVIIAAGAWAVLRRKE